MKSVYKINFGIDFEDFVNLSKKGQDNKVAELMKKKPKSGDSNCDVKISVALSNKEIVEYAKQLNAGSVAVDELFDELNCKMKEIGVKKAKNGLFMRSHIQTWISKSTQNKSTNVENLKIFEVHQKNTNIDQLKESGGDTLLFHGTLSIFLPSILKYGIHQGAGGGVHLTDHFAYADACGNAGKTGCGRVMLVYTALTDAGDDRIEVKLGTQQCRNYVCMKNGLKVPSAFSRIIRGRSKAGKPFRVTYTDYVVKDCSCIRLSYLMFYDLKKR